MADNPVKHLEPQQIYQFLIARDTNQLGLVMKGLSDEQVLDLRALQSLGRSDYDMDFEFHREHLRGSDEVTQKFVQMGLQKLGLSLMPHVEPVPIIFNGLYQQKHDSVTIGGNQMIAFVSYSLAIEGFQHHKHSTRITIMHGGDASPDVIKAGEIEVGPVDKDFPIGLDYDAFHRAVSEYYYENAMTLHRGESNISFGGGTVVKIRGAGNSGGGW